MYIYIYIRYKREKKEVNMLCLEIPGCVQHKLMYGVVLREDLTHHNVEMLYLPGTARNIWIDLLVFAWRPITSDFG